MGSWRVDTWEDFAPMAFGPDESNATVVDEDICIEHETYGVAARVFVPIATLEKLLAEHRVYLARLSEVSP